MLFWTWCVVFTMGEKYILWYTFLLFMLNIQKYNFLPAQKRCLQHEEWDWCETADCCHSSEAVKNTCDDSVISAARFTLRFNFRAVAPGEPESLSLLCASKNCWSASVVQISYNPKRKYQFRIIQFRIVQLQQLHLF